MKRPADEPRSAEDIALSRLIEDALECLPRVGVEGYRPTYDELVDAAVRCGASRGKAEYIALVLLGADRKFKKRAAGRPAHLPLDEYLRLNQLFRWWTFVAFRHREHKALKANDPQEFSRQGKQYAVGERAPRDRAIRDAANKFCKSYSTIERGLKTVRTSAGPDGLPRFLTKDELAAIPTDADG